MEFSLNSPRIQPESETRTTHVCYVKPESVAAIRRMAQETIPKDNKAFRVNFIDYSGFYPMIPCCPSVSMRRYQWCLTETFDEVAHLFLRQNAIECSNEVTHGRFTVASNHIIDSSNIVDIVLPAGRIV